MKTVMIKDLGTIVTGHTPPKSRPEFYGDYVPFIKATDMSENQKYTNITEESYSIEGFAKYRKSLIPKGATCVVTIGTVGKKMTMANKECFVNQAINAIIPNDNYDEEYVYYLLRHNLSSLKTLDSGTTSGRENISKSAFENLSLEVIPNKLQQQRIGQILSAYDSQIENNLKRIKCLEETIAMLFKKWFIWDKKKDWASIRLGEIVYQEKSKLKNWEGMDIVDLSTMPSFSMTLQSFSNPEDFSTNIFKLEKWDLLFGAIRPYLGKAGFAPKDCAVAGTVLHFRVKDCLYYYFTLALITSKYFFDYASCVATGTKMPVIKFEDICRYTVTIPTDKSIFHSFNKIVEPMVKELNRLAVQNSNLMNQRDLLLPRLMSGKLSI